MTMRRHAASAVAVLFLTLVLAQGVAAQNVTLSYITPLWNEDVQKWFNDVAVPRFEALHPGVRVEVSYAVWGDLHAKIVAAAASGVGPDVYVTIGEGGAKGDGENGLALALDEYVAGWDALNDFIPAALETQRSGGHLYAIPNTLNLRTYVVNRNLFEQAGLNPEAPLGDWPSFLEIVGRLNPMLGPAGKSGFRANLNFYFEQVMNEAGAPWLGEDGLLHMDTPGARAAINHLLAMWSLGGPETRMFVQQGGAANDMRDNKAAMAWIDIQQVGEVARGIGREMIAIPDPVRSMAVMPATGLAITATSKHPHLAWEWIAFLSEPENLTTFNALLVRIPPRISTLRAGPVGDDPILQRGAEVAARFGRPVELSNRFGTIANIRNQAQARLFEMFNGVKGPEQVAREIELVWAARVTSQQP